STFNAFATVVASQGAGIPFTDGIVLRFVILALCLAAGIAFVMRYATRVKADASTSVVADQAEDNRAHFLKGAGEDDAFPDLTGTRTFILTLFGLTFAVMIYGVVALDWWMGEMSGLFLTMSILVWWVGKLDEGSRMDEATFVETFVDGARDLLGVALIIGVARGVVVIMDAGKITDTILAGAEGVVSGLSEFLFITVMFGIQILMSFLVPSSSGLATLSMPIMAPLADFAGVGRDLVVTAYQSANGWVNLFNPTFAVVMGGLAIGRVSYDRWLRFVAPLLLVLAVIIVAALSLGAAMS
ncbi:MAG: YfcC family protein, partial [Roseibium sp.]